ncbi:MAG: transcription termination/antitermination NusG family protein [Chloroflexota bacterium]
MALHWYALRSKPRKEDVLFRQLNAHEFKIFYPRVKVNPVNPRARKMRPYFPGYMFVYVDLEEVGVSTFEWMPFGLGLVSFGGEPAIVPPDVIPALSRHLSEINQQGGLRFGGLKPGTPVWITEGPFAGYEAIFDARLPGSVRVKVLLQLLNDRRVPLELHVGQIEPKKQK